MTEADETPDTDVLLDIRTRTDEGRSVLEVAGEIDLVTGDQLRDALRQAIENAPDVLVVDLSEVTFLGSVGLSHLIDAHHGAGPGVLRVVPGRVAGRTIEVACLDMLLTIQPTVDEALSATR